MSGVRPRLSVAFTFAPRTHNAFAASVCPWAAEKLSAHMPKSSISDICAPFSSSWASLSTEPAAAAAISAVRRSIPASTTCGRAATMVAAMASNATKAGCGTTNS
jgi:hypothetical protein